MRLVHPFSLLASLPFLVPPGAAASDPQPQLVDLIQRRAPAIVTVKTVVKVKSESRFSEFPLEFPGVIVDASGLVMGSLRGQGGQIGTSVELTQIKVVLGGGDEELDAFLAAKDSTLDLGFMQIEGLGDRKLPFVSFDEAVPPTVGRTVVTVARMCKGFGYAPRFAEGRVTGRIEKPREAFSLEGRVDGTGLPVFSEGGDVLGVYLNVAPAGEVGNEGGRRQGRGGFRIRIGRRRGAGRPFLVPAEPLRRVIDEARKSAQRWIEERQKEEAGAAPK